MKKGGVFFCGVIAGMIIVSALVAIEDRIDRSRVTPSELRAYACGLTSAIENERCSKFDKLTFEELAPVLVPRQQ